MSIQQTLQKLTAQRVDKEYVAPTVKQMSFNVQETNEKCPIHGDKMLNVFGRVSCAKCGLELIEREKQLEQEQRKEKHLEILLNSAQLPKRHQKCTFANFDAVSGSPQDLARTQAFAHVSRQKQNNVLFVGRTGTGKTHLACAMARTLIQQGKSVHYTTSASFINNVMDKWGKNDSSQKSEIEKFASFDVLIVDEYGLYDQSEKRLEIIHQLLYARYDEEKPTILISNFTLAELQKNLGDRLWSRFQDGGLLTIEFGWNDRRIGAM